MISEFAKHAWSLEVIGLFEEMQQMGMHPDEVHLSMRVWSTMDEAISNSWLESTKCHHMSFTINARMIFLVGED